MTGQIADRLEAAAGGREAVAPFATGEGLTLEAAYEVQAETVRRRVASGARPIGWKLSAVGPAAMDRLGVDAPVMGRLLDVDVLDNGGLVQPAAFIEPMVEVELALVIGRDVAPGPEGLIGLREAVVGVAPAFDIGDARVRGPGLTAADLVADRAAVGAFVLGPVTPVAEAGDLALLGVVLELDGLVVASGAGAQVLGHPVAALGRAVAARSGSGPLLRRGEVVTTGSLVDRVPLPAQGSIHASFARIGSVDLRIG